MNANNNDQLIDPEKLQEKIKEYLKVIRDHFPLIVTAIIAAATVLSFLTARDLANALGNTSLTIAIYRTTSIRLVIYFTLILMVSFSFIFAPPLISLAFIHDKPVKTKEWKIGGDVFLTIAFAILLFLFNVVSFYFIIGLIKNNNICAWSMGFAIAAFAIIIISIAFIKPEHINRAIIFIGVAFGQLVSVIASFLLISSSPVLNVTKTPDLVISGAAIISILLPVLPIWVITSFKIKYGKLSESVFGLSIIVLTLVVIILPNFFYDQDILYFFGHEAVVGKNHTWFYINNKKFAKCQNNSLLYAWNNNTIEYGRCTGVLENDPHKIHARNIQLFWTSTGHFISKNSVNSLLAQNAFNGPKPKEYPQSEFLCVLEKPKKIKSTKKITKGYNENIRMLCDKHTEMTLFDKAGTQNLTKQ